MPDAPGWPDAEYPFTHRLQVPWNQETPSGPMGVRLDRGTCLPLRCHRSTDLWHHEFQSPVTGGLQELNLRVVEAE